MNKKGFTLVEVLAVIVILGLIIGISIPAIDSILDKGISKAEQAQESEFISLAKIYATSNKKSINNLSNGTCYFLSLDTMLEIDMLSEIPKLNGKEYSTTSGVEICKKNTGIEYSYKESSSKPLITTMPVIEVAYDDLVIPSTGVDGTKIKCSSCNEIYSSNTLDEDVGAPELSAINANGLTIIPVIYDEKCDYGNGCWRKADTTKAWYDYGNQRWANAVAIKNIGSYCLKVGNPCYDQIDKHNGSYYATAPANTPISFDDIYSFYVWIPRFDYKITGTYGVGGTQSSPGLIDIQFNSNLNDVKTGDAKNTYYTHPAFTKEIVHSKSSITNHKISGFWVEKFEGNGKLLYQNVYKTYSSYVTYDMIPNTQYRFVDYLDDDMITNFEWAAIAYLSQSQYGIASGNNSKCNKRISSTYIYKTEKTVSGSYKISGYTVPGLISGTSGCYAYDGKNFEGLCSKIENKGVLGPLDFSETPTKSDREEAYCGSTTGTIYGVYDMVGGMSEYVFLTASRPNELPVGTAHIFKDSNSRIYGTSKCEKFISSIDTNFEKDFSTISSNRFLYSKYNNYTISTDTIGSGRDINYHYYVSKSNLKKGDALLETDGWYNNEIYPNGYTEYKGLHCLDLSSINLENNETRMILIRGGSYNSNSKNDNIFGYKTVDGYANAYDCVTRYTYAKTS